MSLTDAWLPDVSEVDSEYVGAQAIDRPSAENADLLAICTTGDRLYDDGVQIESRGPMVLILLLPLGNPGSIKLRVPPEGRLVAG